jgi:hypothetical protein
MSASYTEAMVMRPPWITPGSVSDSTIGKRGPFCSWLAGKTLSDIEVFDLMCAEVLCTFAATPPFDPEDEEDGGFVRSIAERDGWKCTRPGCSCRSALQGNHIIPRSQCGPDQDWNKHIVCAACHLAITEGRLKVSGRAPDGLTWEGPFGVIEKPLPLSGPVQGSQAEENAQGNAYRRELGTEEMWAKEAMSQCCLVTAHCLPAPLLPLLEVAHNAMPRLFELLLCSRSKTQTQVPLPLGAEMYARDGYHTSGG